MKASLSLLALTSALALAVPLNQKRDTVVTVTATTEVIETIYSTTTVWVRPSSSASRHSSAPAKSSASSSAKANTGGEFYERTAVASPASSSQAAAPAPPVEEPTSQPAAPVAAAPAAETPATTSVAAPSVEQVAQAAPTPAAQSSQSSSQAAPSSSSSSSSGSGSGSSSGSNGATVYTGDITYYDPGMGSCGVNSGPDDMIVAVAHRIMANGANPNANPLCGKTVTIDYNGKQTTATIVDTCPGCSGNDLDMSPALFKAVAPNGDGRVSNVNWWINN